MRGQAEDKRGVVAKRGLTGHRQASMQNMAATSPRVTQIIALLDACSPEEYGAVQEYMTAHPPVEEHTLESITPAAIERALEDDVLRVSAELQQPGEGGKSPMLEVQIMAITGDVFPVQVSRDDTVRIVVGSSRYELFVC